MGFGLIFPVMPYFVTNLGATSVHLGLYITVGSLAHVLFAPGWGRLSDRIGRRPILVTGLLGHFAAFIMMVLAPNIWVVLLGQGLGGILSAAITPTAQAYIADITPPQDLARELGFMGALMSMGFVCGPAVGGLVAPLGPYAPFLSAAFLALTNAIFSFFLLKEPPARSGRAASSDSGVLSTLRLIPAAAAGIDRVLYLLPFAASFGSSIMFAMLGFYLMERLNAPPSMLAVAYTFQGLVMVAFQGVVVNRLLQRVGGEWTVRTGLALGVFGFVGFIVSSSYWHVAMALVGVSGAVAILRPVSASLISQRTRLEQGVTMGLHGSFEALGRTLGPPIAGVLFDAHTALPYLLAIAVYGGFLAWMTGGLPEAVQPREQGVPSA